jgi:hypothetical protein
VDLKTLLYVEGIGAAIDSGRWDALEPDAQIDGFDHAFLMRTRGDLLIGRLWSSADGKGRTRYPMVVAAQVTGASIEWALGTILPELEALKTRCTSTTSARDVVAAVESTRASLRGKVLAAGGGPELVIPATFAADLAADPALGPDRLGLHRVLYQIGRELGEYALGVQPPSRIGRIEEPRPHHLRLPAVVVGGPGSGGRAGGTRGSGVDGVGGSLLTAARLLLSKLEPFTTMLLIAPLSRPFVDAIVGEPAGAQLFCLRADTKAIPLATDIPYTIDPAFAQANDRWIQEARSAGDRAVQAPRRLIPGSGRFRMLGLVAGLIAAAGAAAWSPPALAAPQAEREPGPVQPRERYNVALRELVSRLARPGISEADAEAAAREFLSTVRALPGGIAFLAPVQPVLATVEAALADKAGEDLPDPAALGPATTGLYQGAQDGPVVRYRPIGGAGLPELAFVPLIMESRGGPGEPPSRRVVYVGTTEVSVGQFSAIVGFQGAATGLRGLMPRFSTITDVRAGPRAWEWGATPDRPVVPAKRWLRGHPDPDGVPPPTDASPMQYLSPGAALYAARLVGCRLPAPGEWSVLHARFDAPPADGPAPVFNLRDAAWARAADSIRARGGRGSDPDAGMFVPADPAERHAPEQLTQDDGVAWFAPVDQGGGAVVHHALGNVAEYVLEPADGPLPPARSGAVSEYLGRARGGLKVVGGSAMSPITWDPATPSDVVLADAGEGYADVGFRLAFSGGEVLPRALAARLLRRLEPLPLLPGR